ncbi:hypothetical protein ACLKA6_015993 [Drosophila palustris]
MFGVIHHFASTMVAIWAVSVLKAEEIHPKAAMPSQQLTDIKIDLAMATFDPGLNVAYKASCPASIDGVQPSCLPLQNCAFPLCSVACCAAGSFLC